MIVPGWVAHPPGSSATVRSQVIPLNHPAGRTGGSGVEAVAAVYGHTVQEIWFITISSESGTQSVTGRQPSVSANAPVSERAACCTRALVPRLKTGIPLINRPLLSAWCRGALAKVQWPETSGRDSSPGNHIFRAEILNKKRGIAGPDLPDTGPVAVSGQVRQQPDSSGIMPRIRCLCQARKRRPGFFRAYRHAPARCHPPACGAGLCSDGCYRPAGPASPVSVPVFFNRINITPC